MQKKLLKGLLVAAGVVVALLAVVVLAVNLYVQSAGTQRRIEHALSSGLKAPVHLTSTIVTPWSGLKASGLTVPQVPPMTGNFLEAASFTAQFDWLPLFHHQLVARDVSLDEPRILWFQSPDGRWELPRPSPTPGAPPEAVAAKTPHPAGQAWDITVHKLTVSGASFDFWDEKGMRMAEFAGVQFDCLDPRASGTEGRAACKYVSLHDRLFFHDMSMDWSFERGFLKLSSFETGVGGGEIRGEAQLATQAKHSPFSADVRFDGVNVNQLMTEAGQPAGQVTGTLKGWLDLSGNSGKTSTINGSGHLELAGGRMQNIEVLEMLGAGLQIPDLVRMDLKTAEADVRVVSGVVQVDKVLLESQNLQLAAHGTIGIEGKLALQARLTIDAAISDRLPAMILNYFKTGETADARYVDFKIGNTLAHPKTKLFENILGHGIQGQMTDLVKSLFGKKPAPEPAAGTPP